MSKTVRYLLTGCIAVVLLLGAFSGGVLVGWLIPKDIISDVSSLPLPTLQPNTSTTGAPADKAELFEPFFEVWDIVESTYYQQPVDNKEMMRGAIRGMLDSLGDKHTSYMDPQQYDQAITSMGKEYSGIGAWVDTDTKYLTIISPMPGFPAEKAGLKAGDQVIKIDGEDMSDTPASLALQKVLGPEGTDVTLTIQREGQEPFDVTITREKINVPSVESKMLDNNIAYIKINTFGEKTTDELKKALKERLAENPTGMVLDLRYNGGGYVDTCVEVVSQFIPEGIVLIEEFGDGSRKTEKVKPGGIATEIPLVVLVNEATASASEITAGVMQDYNRARIVGVTTYGKGSVQNWIPLQNNEGAVRVTIARWLTPKERAINDVGITPDVVVEISEEDIQAGKDPQLDKAVEILLGK